MPAAPTTIEGVDVRHRYKSIGRRLFLNLAWTWVLGAIGAAMAINAWSSTMGPVVTEATYRVLQQVQRLAESQQLERGLGLIERQLTRVSAHSVDAAMLLRARGTAHILNDDLPSAIIQLEACVRLSALPDTEQSQAILDLIHLYLALSNPVSALHWLDVWMDQGGTPDAQVEWLYAYSHLLAEDHLQSLAAVGRAIELHEGPPPEPWLRLQAGLAYELGDLKRAAATVRRLLVTYNHADDWINLSSLHQLMHDMPRAAATLSTGERFGLLQEADHLLRMVQLQLMAGAPFEAATQLEQALNAGLIEATEDNLKLLSRCWLLAREARRALPVLERLVRDHNDIDAQIQLGLIHFEVGEWESAAKAFDQVLPRVPAERRPDVSGWLAISLEEVRRDAEESTR